MIGGRDGGREMRETWKTGEIFETRETGETGR
jgi:hypothetical protein